MRKKAYIAAAVWWILTAAWIALCLFLTWQSGEGTGRLSLAVAQFLLRILAAVGIAPEAAAFHMLLRKIAHFGVFFVAGLLFCGSTEALWRIRPVNGWIRALCGAAVTLLALFADVPKLWIPGRHLQWGESCLNAAGALAGFLLMEFLVCLCRRGKQDAH